MNVLSEANAAYIAGIIDGEGWVGVLSRAQVTPQVTARMTDRSVIKWLQAVTGVGCYYEYHPDNPNHQDQYEWRVRGIEAQELLNVVRPFMRIKREQARLVLRVNLAKTGVERRRGLTPGEIARRAGIRSQITRLNLRGLAAVQRNLQ